MEQSVAKKSIAERFIVEQSVVEQIAQFEQAKQQLQTRRRKLAPVFP